MEKPIWEELHKPQPRAVNDTMVIIVEEIDMPSDIGIELHKELSDEMEDGEEGIKDNQSNDEEDDYIQLEIMIKRK